MRSVLASFRSGYNAPMPGSMTLGRAIAIAAEAHAKQLRNEVCPYILHPLEVMRKQTSLDARIAGVLHDVVEDCEGWDFDRLSAEGCPPAALEAVRLLTHEKPAPRRDDETLEQYFQRVEDDYLAYITRLAGNPIARAVKWGDLEHNIGSRVPTRQVDIDDPQRYTARLRRYDEARMILHRHWPHDETHPSAGRFCDSGLGEFMSNWSVTDKDGNPVEIPTDD